MLGIHAAQNLSIAVIAAEPNPPLGGVFGSYLGSHKLCRFVISLLILQLGGSNVS
jgi:hypothetical protein